MENKTLAYKKNITIENPQHLVLSNLPVKVGQQVEVLILIKTETSAIINPAQNYADTDWDELTPDERSELETKYILNNPILMKQIHDKSEWFTVSLEQLDINENYIHSIGGHYD